MNMKKLGLFLVMMLLPLVVSAQECVDGIFYYFYSMPYIDGQGNEVVNRYASVTYDHSVDIWSSGTIDTYQGDLVIPETVNYQGEPYNVTQIDCSAFRNCHGLTSISLPKTISYICDDTGLPQLSNLKSITVDADNPYYISADNGVLYDKNKTRIYCLPAKRGGTYTIPAAITSIDYTIGRPQLDELIIPATVDRLGNSFIECNWNNNAKIKKLTIEDSDTELSVGTGNCGTGFTDENGNWVNYQPLFYNCGIEEIYWGRNLKFSNKYSSPFSYNSELTKVVIGPKVTTIPNYSFIECGQVQTIDVKGGFPQWCGFDLSGPYASPFVQSQVSEEKRTVLFNGETLIGNVTIPDAVNTIPSHAFQYGVANVTSLSIHANVTEIRDGAFRGLAMLQNIYLDAANETFKVQDGILYDKDITKILLYPRLKEGEYVIPSTVLSIGDYQFSGCTKLTALTIPASVLTIGTYAFDGCTTLTKLVMEDSATPITWPTGRRFFGTFPVKDIYFGRNINTTIYSEGSIFSNSLDHVGIGSNVTRMPANMFMWTEVAKVDFDGTIIDWCNITFENEYATPFGYVMMACPILYLKGQPLHSQVNIPEGATKIGAYAFYGQRGVTNITVPSTVKTIEPYAFSGIGDVYINANSLISLSNTNSFSGYVYISDDWVKQYKQASVWSDIADRIYPKGFLQVTVDLVAMSSSPALLPALNALERVNDEYRITALTNLKIKGTMNGWDILMIRNKMPNLRYLDLSEATILTNDGGYEYYQGYHTQTDTISPYMFYGLSNLRNVILPEGIKYIGSYAFSQSGISDIIIPGTVKEIGYYAFENCQNLKNLTLTKGLERIGSRAFGQCNSLTSLVFPTTLKEIEWEAFTWCNSLSTIDFAEGLQYINDYAFYYCPNLKNLHFPTSLRRIGSYAFNNCSGLTEVHVPSMITEIGDYAFKDCGLKSVYAYTVVPVQINQNTFDYKGVDLYAPDNSFYAYYLNTQWSQFQDVKEFEAKYLAWYTPRNIDVEINTSCPIKNQDDNDAAEGNMEPGSGLIFVGDGEQLVKKLILNWQHGANYPSLIENGNLNVDELAFILNVYPGRWYFFSFPFDVKLNDIKLNGGKWVWRYYDAETRAANGSGGWKNVEGNVLKANQGYIFQSNTAGDLELPVGNPDYTQQANSDEKEIDLQTINARNPQDASWNFVGNPNLSYYGLDDMAETFDAPITVWDQEQQTYTAVVPGDDDYDFHPFEAYFVQTPDNASSLTFENDKRATYSQTEKKAANRARRRAAMTVNENRLLVNLTLSDGNTTDKTRVIFNDENQMTYEAGRDANKFMSMANVPQLYTLDAQDVKYSVNNRPNGNREVRVGFVANAEGTYTIAADRMDCRMALKDNLTGTVHQLDGESYSFYSEAGTFDNRFTLVPGSEATAITAKSIDGLNMAAIDGGLAVSGAYGETLNVYKTNGVKAASLQGTGTVKLASGTYIVSYAGKTAKIMVK